MKHLFSVLLLTAASHAFADVVIVNNDSGGEGFNDTTSVSAVGGNTATTLGAQRLAVFQEAADILNATYDITAVVKVASTFDPLSCSSSSAVLGQAGPAAVEFDYSTHSLTPHALYNQTVNADADAGVAEINAQFNSAIDNNDNCLFNTNWYYGFDAPSGNGKSLLSVVLHEILHGMGFLTYLQSNGQSGAGWNTVNGFEEAFDPYTRLMKDASSGQFLTAQAISTRASVMTSNGNLVWGGSEVNGEASNYSSGINNGEVRLYAPSSYESGSTASHFDTALSPNELMEPQYTEFLDTPGLAEQLLKDIGWDYNAANIPNSAPVMGAISNVTVNEDASTTVSLSATDANSDPLTYSITSADSSLGASISGATITIAPSANYNGSGSITAQVSDGTDTDTVTFTVTVTAVNDAPVLTGVGTQTMLEDTSVNITLNATDIESDSLTYSLTSASAQLNASISGAVLTLTPAANYNGSGSVTVQVADASLSDSETFSVTVQNSNDAPSISAISDVEFDYDSSTTITLAGNDIDGDSLTYSAVSADTGIVTTSVSGNQLTLTSATSAIASTSITVTVNDGNATANTTFTVDLTDPATVDPITLTIAGSSISDGDTASGALGTITLIPTGGDGDYTLTAEFNGSDVSDLLTASGSSVALNLPDEGAFAGTYTVVVTDGLSTSASFYVERPLRLSTSVTPILEGSDTARLIIEGAPASTEILLSSDSSLSFSNAEGVTIASVDASDSENNEETAYNPATAVLISNDSTATTITASAANIPDSTLDLVYVARRSVTLMIKDESGNPIADADVTIDDDRMIEWGLTTEFTSASDGSITFDVPELALTVNVSATLYDDTSLTLSATGTEVNAVMSAASTEYQLAGQINARGFDFDSELPALEIHLNDGTTTTPVVEKISNTQVSYTWESSLSSSLPESLSVSHSEVVDVDIALNPAFEEENINLTLVSDSSTDSGAGNALWLLLLSLVLIPTMRRPLSPQ
ncbi:MAG: Ig-like domain-containing protein [Alcanivorax sp.]|jgi:hypothetical protein